MILFTEHVSPQFFIHLTVPAWPAMNGMVLYVWNLPAVPAGPDKCDSFHLYSIILVLMFTPSNLTCSQNVSIGLHNLLMAVFHFFLLLHVCLLIYHICCRLILNQMDVTVQWYAIRTIYSISYRSVSSVLFIFKWPFDYGAPRHQATHRTHVMLH